MKRTLLIALFGLFLVACDSDEVPSIPENGIENLSTKELRTEAEAIEIATKALNDFYPVKSRSANDLSQLNVVMLNSSISRGQSSNPLYVVNFGEESGYAIVSSDKNAQPLLAITESGSISKFEDIDNPGLRMFVDNAIKLEADTTDFVFRPGGDGGELVDVWRNDTVFHVNTKVEPRLRVNWGQQYPEGRLCPNNKCGCVATAGAQALSLFEYPSNLTLTFPERKSDQITLDWYNMKRLITPSFSLGDIDMQLSSLCREIGYKINAVYNINGGTSASLYDLRDYFKGILPTNKFVISNLVLANPNTNSVLGNGVILIGANQANETVGHAWVIDGYIYKKYTVYVYYRKINSPVETLERQFDKTDLYSHVNWGWNGSDNGYFYNNIFRTSSNNFNQDFCYFTINTK